MQDISVFAVHKTNAEDDMDLVDYHIIPVDRNFLVATQSVNELVKNAKVGDRYILRNGHFEKTPDINIYLLLPCHMLFS